MKGRALNLGGAGRGGKAFEAKGTHLMHLETGRIRLWDTVQQALSQP